MGGMIVWRYFINYKEFKIFDKNWLINQIFLQGYLKLFEVGIIDGEDVDFFLMFCGENCMLSLKG